jgi:UBX domain-containing protein 1
VGGDEVEEGLQKVTLTAWQGGVFSLDDGVNPVVPRSPATDPEFAKFLDAVMKGHLPPGFTSDTHLVFEDRREEDFKPPPMKPFSGAGRRLGDVVPPVAGAGAHGAAAGAGAAAAAPAATLPPQIEIDESQPTTRVQIRLADGTRLVGRFNPTQTVADLR